MAPGDPGFARRNYVRDVVAVPLWRSLGGKCVAPWLRAMGDKGTCVRKV